MGGDPIPGPLDVLRELFESGSHVQSCGALSAEAGPALPLDGAVKCCARVWPCGRPRRMLRGRKGGAS